MHSNIEQPRKAQKKFENALKQAGRFELDDIVSRYEEYYEACRKSLSKRA